MAAPYIFNIRGGGLFWGFEFDHDAIEAAGFNFGKEQLGMLIQARALKHGAIIMGMTGGGNLEGTKGDHIMLSPAYNVTKEEIEMTVDIVVQSVEEILTEAKSA
jgi:adenosylmethionine-8-amino-7-oxononanoate aminotransferase